MKKEEIFALKAADLSEISNFCQSLEIIIASIIQKRRVEQDSAEYESPKTGETKIDRNRILMDIF